MILHQIAVCARRNKGGLWFPSLITQLCKNQGVVIDPHEAIEQAAPAITTDTIARLLQTEQIEGSDNEDASAADAHPPASSRSTQTNFISGLHRLEQRVSQMEVTQYETLELLQEQQQQWQTYWQYVSQRDRAVEQTFRLNFAHFHHFPTFPQQLFHPTSMDTDDAPVPPSVPNPAAASPSTPSDPSNRPQPAEPSSEAAPPTTSARRDTAKGKAVAAEPSSRKSRLRSATSKP